MAKKKMLCISINGGGALGIWVSQFMHRLESDLGKSLAQLGQAFAGTSTGAIIAAGLAEGMSGTEIAELYVSKVKKMFTEYPWYKRVTPSCPKYDNSNLKNILKSILPGKMNEFKKPIFIPTTLMNGESMEKVWDNDDTEEKWFSVLSSTAAPTYFDVLIKDGKSYCDGGMWANDPCMTLQAGLKNLHPDWEIKVLTFNTGLETPNTDSGNKNLLGWGEWVLDNWVASAGNSNYYELCANIGKENVFRVSPKSNKKIKMDKTDNDTIKKLISIGNDEYDRVRDELLKWINN